MKNGVTQQQPKKREAPVATAPTASRIPTRSEVRKARRASVKSSQVIPDLSMWAHASRIGGGITPQMIASIIRSADAGDHRQLIDLANECRQRDSHLQAVLGTHEESIAGLSWQVVAPMRPGSEKPRTMDKRAAAWCEEQLRNNPGVQNLIAQLTGGYFYSYSVAEIVWRKEGGKLVPDHFVSVAPRRFRFRREDSRLVWQDDGITEVDYREKYPNKFITTQPRVTGDIPSREGLARVLIYMSTMRNWVIFDWLRTGEMSWKPWRIGKFKKDVSTAKDRTDLEEIMRRMTTDFTAVVPDSCEIDITWPGGTGSQRSSHGELANVLAQEMSKAVLGQTETTQASSSSGYAQAKVHDAVRRDLRETRARQIAADITRDLIGPMIRLNFGVGVEVPRFEFVTQDPIDLKEFADSLKTMRDAGARIPEKWALDQAGIPEPKEGERVLGDSVEGEEDEEEPGKPDDEETKPTAPGDEEVEDEDDAAEESPPA